MSCYLMYLERITDSQAMRKLKFVYCLQIILWKKSQTHNFLQKKDKIWKAWNVLWLACKINKTEGEGIVMRGDKQQWMWFITMILLSMELQQFRLWNAAICVYQHDEIALCQPRGWHKQRDLSHLISKVIWEIHSSSAIKKGYNIYGQDSIMNDEQGTSWHELKI